MNLKVLTFKLKSSKPLRNFWIETFESRPSKPLDLHVSQDLLRSPPDSPLSQTATITIKRAVQFLKYRALMNEKSSSSRRCLALTALLSILQLEGTWLLYSLNRSEIVRFLIPQNYLWSHHCQFGSAISDLLPLIPSTMLAIGAGHQEEIKSPPCIRFKDAGKSPRSLSLNSWPSF